MEADCDPPATPSRCDRLGGDVVHASVVDDLDEAHHRMSAAGFKFLVTEMLCWAAGGPQQYSGRSMGDAHRDLMITEEEWQAFMDDVAQTLDKFAVPQPERQEVIAIVESTKEAIVVAPFQEGPTATIGGTGGS